MLQRSWPAEGVTRVPYWVYQDAEIYAEEQARIWRGRTWNYLCLEAELAEPRSFVTTFVGDMPVVVTRDANGALRSTAWCSERFRTTWLRSKAISGRKSAPL